MRATTTARRERRPSVRPILPYSLIALASQNHLDAAKLEQLIAAEERQERRSARVKYARAFAEMSGQLPIIGENGVLKHGDQVVSTYALWEDINEAIRPILVRFGFALSFRVSQEGDSITVTAVLMHSGGHMESTDLRLPPDATGDKNSIQAVGSSVSYGKRYAATAILNLTSRGEDDDGRRAAGCVSPADVEALEARLLESGADRTRLLRYLQIEDLSLLPASRLQAANDAIAAKATKPRGKR